MEKRKNRLSASRRGDEVRLKNLGFRAIIKIIPPRSRVFAGGNFSTINNESGLASATLMNPRRT